LLAALGGLAAALAIPVLSLGPAPGRSLFETPWKKGSRLVGFDGQPIRADTIPPDGVQTVFPEGSVGSADGQTLLIHAGTDLPQLPIRMEPDGTFTALGDVSQPVGPSFWDMELDR